MSFLSNSLVCPKLRQKYFQIDSNGFAIPISIERCDIATMCQRHIPGSLLCHGKDGMTVFCYAFITVYFVVLCPLHFVGCCSFVFHPCTILEWHPQSRLSSLSMTVSDSFCASGQGAHQGRADRYSRAVLHRCRPLEGRWPQGSCHPGAHRCWYFFLRHWGAYPPPQDILTGAICRAPVRIHPQEIGRVLVSGRVVPRQSC